MVEVTGEQHGVIRDRLANISPEHVRDEEGAPGFISKWAAVNFPEKVKAASAGGQAVSELDTAIKDGPLKYLALSDEQKRAIRWSVIEQHVPGSNGEPPARQKGPGAADTMYEEMAVYVADPEMLAGVVQESQQSHAARMKAAYQQASERFRGG